MHIKSLIATLIVIQSFEINAQENKLIFGVFAGPSYTTYLGNDVLNAYRKPLIAFSTGLSFQYSLNKFLAVKTGVGFEQKGIKSSFPTYTEGSVYSISKINYLTMPTLVRFSFGKSTFFFANGGAYFGLFLNQLSIIYGDGIEKTKNKNTTSPFEKIDYGATFGIGIGKKIKNTIGISFELRTNYGINNLAKGYVINYGTIQTFNACGLFEFNYFISKSVKSSSLQTE